MKKIFLSVGIVLVASVMHHLHAQSIDNRNWKAFLGAPINDTVVLHIRSDSSFLANSIGEVVIRLQCMITGDTLIISNQDADQHGCPDQKGKYKIDLNEDSFILTLVNDACEGRSTALTGTKWKAEKN